MSDLPEPSDSHPSVLLTDFDGTMTKQDFFRRALAHLPPDAGEFWERYRRNELSLFEALQGIFAQLPGDEQQVMRIAREAGLDPQVGNAIDALHRAGWQVVVVSAGTDWYSRRLLSEQGVDVPVIANPATLMSSGLQMDRLPRESPYFSTDIGVHKAAVTRAALERFERVGFAGDSVHDLEAAELVPAEYRFACGWLADHFDKERVPYRRFENWSEISRQLIGSSTPAGRSNRI